MAKGGDSGSRVSAHPLVRKLRAGGDKSQAELTTIVGFLGEPEGDGSVKLYLDISFGSYCKLAVSDIVNTKPVDPSDENSPTVVWIKSSAKLELVKVTNAADGGDFIRGRIQQERLSRVSASGDAEMLTDASTWTCPRPTLDTCPATWMWCTGTVM